MRQGPRREVRRPAYACGATDGKGPRQVRGQGRGGAVATAGVLAALLALGACSGVAQEAGADQAATPRATSTAERSAVTAPPTTGQRLERFYTQRLSWVRCSSFQCARLTVPLDYADPTGATLDLALLKVPARSGKPIGALLVNPGGPGASAVQHAARADRIVSPGVRRHYDVIGLDPRGVGQSAPVTCLDDRAMDEFIAADPTPDDAAERSAFLATARRFTAACQARAGDLLAHVSTVEAAKDMDVLRAALGQTKLDYLGQSYGTFLGATYADLFPGRVGRFVLDGAVPPDLSWAELNEGQAVGFEQATRRYVAACVRSASCPLGTSVDAGMQRLQGFLAELDQAPIATADRYVKRLTEGWGSVGIALAMYDEGLWPSLTRALRAAFRGDGSGLLNLGNAYARRDSSGKYTENLLQAIFAVNCLDRQESADPEHYEEQSDRFTASAPTWGRLLAWGSAVCGVWPVPATGKVRPISAEGSGPIVVVGTTRDPATPYRWAQRLADQLADGHLITYDGDGHTAYRRSNACVDRAVDAFLLRGDLPAAGLRC